MYAIIKTGGKQYRVSEGEAVQVEKLNAEVGAEVVFDEVLTVVNDVDVKIGAPVVEGAKVTAKVVEHGKADKIKVAGSIENNTLMFSVQDNGSGFTPDTAPGITEGHFGLQGIRERIDELGGTFMVSSTPGKGTKATVTITLPGENKGNG